MADEQRISKVPDTERTAHPAEEAIVDARRAKAERVRARGENPFSNDVSSRLGARRR